MTLKDTAEKMKASGTPESRLIALYKGIPEDSSVYVEGNEKHIEGLKRIADEYFLRGHVTAQEELSENDLDEEDDIIRRDRADQSQGRIMYGMDTASPNNIVWTTGTVSTANHFKLNSPPQTNLKALAQQMKLLDMKWTP